MSEIRTIDIQLDKDIVINTAQKMGYKVSTGETIVVDMGGFLGKIRFKDGRIEYDSDRKSEAIHFIVECTKAQVKQRAMMYGYRYIETKAKNKVLIKLQK